MAIQQPGRDLSKWFLWIESLAVVGLFGTLIQTTDIQRDELKAKDVEIKSCQEERIKAELAHQAELVKINREVQDFREEVYRASMNQQKLIKRIKK